MSKNIMAVIILTVVFLFTLIVAIPIVILSDNFSSFGLVEEPFSYYYAPNNSSTSEELNLDIDRSEVKIKYANPPFDFVVKIDVYFEISGAGAQGKSYLEYFDIAWENGSSPLNFTMTYKPGTDPLEVSSLFSNVSIIVILRSDVVFDINTEIEDGRVDLLVPFMVTINNVKVNNTFGHTFLNFTNCVVSGTITGITYSGYIELNAYKTQYTQNNLWTLESNSGEIVSFITHTDQYSEIGANITGKFLTKTGQINFVYRDNIPDIGAVFTFFNTTTEDGNWEGFVRNIVHDPLYMRYTSEDFPTTFNYNISFYKPLLTGEYAFNIINN